MKTDEAPKNLVSLHDIDISDSPLQKLYITIPLKVNETHPVLQFIYNTYQIKNRFNRPDPICTILASVMNACITQGVMEFLLSKNILNTLILNDVNITNRTTIDGKTFNRFFAKMKSPSDSKPLLLEKRIPNKRGGIEARAGLYEILIKEIREAVGNKELDSLAIGRIVEMDQKNSIKSIIRDKNDDEEWNDETSEIVENAIKNVLYE